MTKPTSNALRRADRVVACAFLLTVSFSGGIVLGHNAPSTEQVASAAAVTTQKTVHLIHGAETAASGAENLVVHATYAATNAEVAMAVPAIATTGNLAEPFKTVTSGPSTAELTMMRVLEDQRCLAQAMYYEARGEGREGQEAIAEVVFHRMRTPGYPHSICGVVFQGADSGRGCQFSFACDGQILQPKSSAAWSRARTLAAKIMAGAVRLGDITGDAISFHAADVQPDWADRLERTIQIGNHVFYRTISRTKAS